MTEAPAYMGYTDSGGGQIHWRMWGGSLASGPLTEPDLYCLHPAPFSGLFFQNVAPLLAHNRRVIAPDYPGYGGSTLPSGEASIAKYAQSIASVAHDLSGNAPVDALGFHTGCLVAVETGLIAPDLLRKACLIDVPTVDAETARKLAEKYKSDVEITAELSSLEEIWSGTFVNRIETVGIDKAFGLFAERLRAGRKANTAFAAAFVYPWQERFSEFTHDAMVIASQSSLLESTREASKALPEAKFVERLDITWSVLDVGAPKIAGEVEEFLSGEAR